MISKIDYRKKFRGAMLGVAVGDAIGAPFEGGSPTSLEEVEKSAGSRERLEFTDDTEMTIGVAESLVSCTGFNGEDIARTF
ncbi:MAG: ADP-ribosylglycohydrolase family protein, partial [Candidatus Hadarchaeales archaeon]